MDWYIVIKTINGRRYKYRQKTWREGGRVRTRSEYIGPAGDSRAPSPHPEDLSGATTLPLPFPVSGLIDDRAAAKWVDRLMDPDATFSIWEHHWRGNRVGQSKVQELAVVTKMLEVLDVHMTDETAGAYYSPKLDHVNIPPAQCFDDMNGQSATSAYYVVLFHELVHWTGGPQRFGRIIPGSEEYAREELVAELGAVLLMEYFGRELGNERRHGHYFQHWLKRAGGKKAAIAHAKREALRAVRYLLENGKVIR